MGKLIKTKDIAQHFGLSESAVIKWRLRGTGPPFLRIGRTIRYNLHDVEKWMKTRRYKSTTQADHKHPYNGD